MTDKALTIPHALNERLIRGRVLTNILLIVGASAIIAIAAQIALPVPGSPVPLTMQPLAVLLVGAVLGAKRGAAAAALYLLEGASGLPVFSQGRSGAMWLAGPTAGYLMSYPFAAFVAGWFSERGWAVRGMFAALAVIYAGGFAWLSVLSGPGSAFTMGIAPFLIADLVKVAFGAALFHIALSRVRERVARSAG